MRWLLGLLLILLTLDSVPAQVVPVTLYYTSDRLITMPGNHSIIRRAYVDTAAGYFTGNFIDEFPGGIKISEGRYRDGKLNGPLTAYYPNGVPFANGVYRNGRKYGTWRYYFADGRPLEVIEFDSTGVFIVQTAFDNEGRQIVNRGTGKWTKALEGKSKPDYLIKAEFDRGKRVGRWVVKSKYGHSYHVEWYDDGKLTHVTDRYKKRVKGDLKTTIDDRFFAFDQIEKTGEFAVTMYAARHYPDLKSVLNEAPRRGSTTSYAFPDSLLITMDLHTYLNSRLRSMADTLGQEYQGVTEVRVTESMGLETNALSFPGSVLSVEDQVAGIIRNAPPLVRTSYNFRPGFEFLIYYKRKRDRSPYAFIFFSMEDLEAYLERASG